MAKRPIKSNKASGKSGNFRTTGITSGIKKGNTNSKVKPIQDARQKLLQKKRKTVVDARDVLAKLAKGQDARSKLDKIRQTRPSRPATRVSNIKMIGNHIVQKIDRNGKISLSTNKNKSNVNMTAAIKKELGLMPAKKMPPKRSVRHPVRPQVSLADIEHAMYNKLISQQSFESPLYKWTKQSPGTTASQMIGSLEPRQSVRITSQKAVDNFQGWQNFPISKTMRAPRLNYLDLDAAMEDEEMPTPKQTISLQGPSRISNIHSRLDRHLSEPETHGILAQTKTKVVVPAGHRIVVSNLQSTVTQDDVKELFEDIGQLLAARLVRPGVAEVIYKNLKDAQKAVDTYHNRQLDGQPMKCLLVNKRPISNPTAPPLRKMQQGFTTVAAPPTSNKLVPDLSTIHKVLFQRK